MTARSTRTSVLLAVLFAILLGTCLLLWLYYPIVPHSVLGWILLFVIGIPTWAFLEWLGDMVLGAKVFSRLGPKGRIALGVPVLILLIAIAAVVVWLGQQAIAGS